MRIADKRPQTFEEIRGQERAVRFLSQLLLREARPRNIVLHGAIGSGKTSMARIYAKALNCSSRTKLGSPCGVCLNCQEPLDKHLKEYDVPGVGADPEKLRSWLNMWKLEPLELPYRTLFLDEAHALGAKGADVLLKSVEEAPDRIVFAFATTEIESIRPALRSRLAQLEVEAFSPDVSLAFLRDMAASVGILYEDEALALLASIKNGYPRDLLIGVEQVAQADGSVVTRSRVKSVFDVDHTDALVDYAMALGKADAGSQMACFMRWREPTRSKVRWVQTFLLAVYYRRVLGCDLTIDPLIDAIDAHRLSDALHALRERFNVTSNYLLQPFMRDMLGFWSSVPEASDDASLLLHIHAFHEHVNASGFKPENVAEAIASVPLMEGAAKAVSNERTSGILDVGQQLYFTASDAREVVRAASFLGQEYGQVFDARFEVSPAEAGLVGEAAYQSVVTFCSEILPLLCAPSRSHYLGTVERNQRGLVATVLISLGATLSLAPSLRDLTTRASLLWSNLCGSKCASGLYLEVLPKSKKPFTEHWNGIRHLCGALADDDKLSSMEIPLIEALGIKKARLRASGPISGPKVIMSASLSMEAMDKAAEERMGFLSAFDDHAWDHIASGWELEEYLCRVREIKKRDRDISAIQHGFGISSSQARARMATVKRGWPADPKDRVRTWRGWWREGNV